MARNLALTVLHVPYSLDGGRGLGVEVRGSLVEEVQGVGLKVVVVWAAPLIRGGLAGGTEGKEGGARDRLTKPRPHRNGRQRGDQKALTV